MIREDDAVEALIRLAAKHTERIAAERAAGTTSAEAARNQIGLLRGNLLTKMTPRQKHKYGSELTDLNRVRNAIK